MSDESLNAERPTQSGPTPPPSFVRAIQTPPGLPWDQHRAAELEARAGSPVTDPMIRITIRRLTPWRPRKVGRFEAKYERPAPVVIQPFERNPTRSDLPSWLRGDDGQLAKWIPGAAVAGAVGLSLMAALILGEMRQAETATAAAAMEARLTELEISVVQSEAALRNQALVESAGLTGRSLETFLEDLGWASRTLAPEAEVSQLGWEEAGLTISTSGSENPFGASDRAVERSGAASTGATIWRVDQATGLSEEAAIGTTATPTDRPDERLPGMAP